MKAWQFFAVLAVASVFASCARNFEHVKFTSSQSSAYTQQLATSRMQKDLFFKSNPSSPLTNEQRIAFHHLGYFAPNLKLVFQVKLINSNPVDSINIPATGGELRPALKFGEFNFGVDGKRVHLFVYKMFGEGSTELFLPFTDETCGNATYAGGRYIDLNENGSGIYRLDFNYAYNPYCAYNHDFSCPIVPQENHLDVPITAGEMKFE
ncbi:MAG: DUF1684 domain-containing protein [Candidatus Kryptoniota bacterium]